MKIVIDIETLGRRNDTAITQIGIVVADDNYNVIADKLISISPNKWNTCNRTFTGETLIWWMQQNNSPVGNKEGYDYKGALKVLRRIIDTYQSDTTFIYTKGVMDLFCLKDLYEYFGEEIPWLFWQPRDIRSIKDMVPNWVTIKENSHNALEDALNELEEMKLNLGKK